LTRDITMWKLLLNYNGKFIKIMGDKDHLDILQVHQEITE